MDQKSADAVKAAIRQEIQSLALTVERLPERRAAEAMRLLRETDRAIQGLIGESPAAATATALPSADLPNYFPIAESPIGPSISAEEWDVADERWASAVARGHAYRTRALEQIGPLLTPREVSGRLGVSVTTVNNWRRQDKLLGVRFDDHQYLYPSWQFVTSPAEGHSGILYHLDEVLASLGPIHPWEKARFILAHLPFLGGRTPLEVIRHGTIHEVEQVKGLASRWGEMGA